MNSTQYGQDFYDGQIVGSLQSSQLYLYHLFSIWGVPQSVADVGCGRGAWLATCRDYGVKRTVGIDGDWNSQAAMLDDGIEFHPTNLEKKLTLTEMFDLALSLEVAEHLQPESSELFVDSIAGLSDVVLFGAAFSGQPGVNHINTRPHSFWFQLFRERGYQMFDLFRALFWNDDRVEPCYRQNTFLYVKLGHSLCNILATRGFTPNANLQLIDSVHPTVYLGLVAEFNKLQHKLLSPQSGDETSCCTENFAATPLSVELILQKANEQAEINLTLAEELYKKALLLEPKHAECLLRLSQLLARMKRYKESHRHIVHFLEMVKDIAFPYFLAGYTARELGHWEEARMHLLKAVELDPANMFTRVLCCMSLVTISMNEDELLLCSQIYEKELSSIIQDTALENQIQIDAAAEAVTALTPFFVPYLGIDVKDLQSKYGRWVSAIMAAKYPDCMLPSFQRPISGKVGVGIVSNYFCDHSNWKIPIKGWLEQLDRKLFAVHCYYTGEISDAATEAARLSSDSFLHCSDVEAVASNIIERRLDVLIYPGIGMDAVTLQLAALRLASVQCASWGHPVTTGMPTIDFYISSDLMEPTSGDGHYTEKLVRLPNLSIWQEPPPTNFDLARLPEITGVGAHDVLFLCNQNLLKYLPQHDFIFPAIARKVANARFIFISSTVSELTEKFMRRLEAAFHGFKLNAVDYVTFLPQLDKSKFAKLSASADIFLDSIEWSGCNTVFESLPYNKPIVTIPGKFMRGRHAYAILKMMGVESTIAYTLDEYINIAAKLANDIAWRKEIALEVAHNKHKIYRDRTTVDALENFLMQVTRMGAR